MKTKMIRLKPGEMASVSIRRTVSAKTVMRSDLTLVGPVTISIVRMQLELKRAK